MPKSALEIRMQGKVRAEAQALQDTFLNTLGWKGVRKLEQFATVNAARALAKPVRDGAPKGSGLLAKSVRGRRSRITRPGAVVGPVMGKKHSWWAWFVVRGTKPHTIPKMTVGSVLRPNQRFIQHPGTRPDPFVDRAVMSNIGLGEDAFGATVVLLLNDEAKRNKVLGLEESYKNGTAAQWQSKPYMRHWKNADYIDPLWSGLKLPHDAPDRVKIIAAGRPIYDAYNRQRGSAAYGVVPRVKTLRGI